MLSHKSKSYQIDLGFLLMVYNRAMPPDYPQQPGLPPQQPPQPPVQGPYTQPAPAPYDFIINPESPVARRSTLPGLPPANSLLLRVIYGVVGLIILLILFSVIKGLIVGKPKLDSFVSIAQDQQELIHLATNAAATAQQQSLSTGNQNVAATLELTITSNQAQITKYLSTNHLKVNTKTLSLKQNTTVDTELTNAQSAGTYNQAFQQVIESQLSSYSTDLKLAYSSAGINGRALLSSDYKQAQLLYTEASSTADLSD
jgi:hypothetical protein